MPLRITLHRAAPSAAEARQHELMIAVWHVKLSILQSRRFFSYNCSTVVSYDGCHHIFSCDMIPCPGCTGNRRLNFYSTTRKIIRSYTRSIGSRTVAPRDNLTKIALGKAKQCAVFVPYSEHRALLKSERDARVPRNIMQQNVSIHPQGNNDTTNPATTSTRSQPLLESTKAVPLGSSRPFFYL